MLTKLNFSYTNKFKILLLIPFLLLSNTLTAGKNKQNTNLQKLVKQILILEFNISDELSRKIDPVKLPCSGFFEHLTTKTKQDIIYALSPITIIIGVNSFLELTKELADSDKKEFITIEQHEKFLNVKVGKNSKQFKLPRKNKRKIC